MQDNFNFGINYVMTVTKENISGVLFDVDALKTDGTVCDIANLNRVSIDLILQPAHGQLPYTVFSGYLQDLLNAMYTQDTRMVLFTQKLNSGYKIMLNFNAYPVTLKEGESFLIKVNFDPLAFTSLSKNASSINVQTIPSVTPNFHGFIPFFETHTIEAEKENIDLQLGDNVVNIVLAVDNVNSYDSTTNAKIESMDLQSTQFNKSVDKNLLIAENMEYISFNPDTPVKNLILYREDTPLDDVKLKAKFNTGVTKGTKIITTKLQAI